MYTFHRALISFRGKTLSAVEVLALPKCKMKMLKLHKKRIKIVITEVPVWITVVIWRGRTILPARFLQRNCTKLGEGGID
jgi:hypothetical protein